MSKGHRSRTRRNGPVLMGGEITGTGKVRGRLGPSLRLPPFTCSGERQGFKEGNGMTRFARTQVALAAMCEEAGDVRVLQLMRSTWPGAVMAGGKERK